MGNIMLSVPDPISYIAGSWTTRSQSRSLGTRVLFTPSAAFWRALIILLACVLLWLCENIDAATMLTSVTGMRVECNTQCSHVHITNQPQLNAPAPVSCHFLISWDTNQSGEMSSDLLKWKYAINHEREEGAARLRRAEINWEQVWKLAWEC